MKREDSLQIAARIATLIHDGSRNLASCSFGSAPLLAMLPIFCFASKYDERDDLHEIKQLDGGFVREILIFGSTARGSADVGDLDIMVLDDGYFSPVFEPTAKQKERKNDWYISLSGNLDLFLSGYLGLEDWMNDQSRDKRWLHDAVDLHVLPVSVLWSEFAQERIGKLHRDPHFLDNAFSAVLRFNCDSHSFEPTTIRELRKMHMPVGTEQQEESA